jgi:mycothiol synthase
MTAMTDDDARPTTWLELPEAPPIPGLRFRRSRRDDADYEAMAEVFRASNEADHVPYAPSAANLREDFEDQPAFDPDVDFVIAEVDGVQVANAGQDRVQRGESIVYEVYGHVVPAWRRRGLGRTLLAANLRRARERATLDAVGRDPRPAYAGSFTEEAEVGHRRLLAEAGFETVRYFFDMARDLAQVEVSPLPDGLEVRPVTPDQHRAIWEADVEAFRDHWQARQPEEADFANLFAKADLDTSLWVVAWDGDDVAGSVQPWIWKDENATLGLRRAWLEHISVRRPWRGRGLARALTTEALRRLRDAGMTEAMLGVDAANLTGALGLYESMGFQVASRSEAGRLRLR